MAVSFGFPNQIQTLKNPIGETDGIILVNCDSIKKTRRHERREYRND
jgi:hypothetical protein